MAFLYGRAGRLTAKNGGFWPGQGAASAMSESGEVAFKRQLYQSMVGQLLFLKTEIEGWRSQNVWGTTIWMYNEVCLDLLCCVFGSTMSETCLHNPKKLTTVILLWRILYRFGRRGAG
jgi:hypothetical protein